MRPGIDLSGARPRSSRRRPMRLPRRHARRRRSGSRSMPAMASTPMTVGAGRRSAWSARAQHRPFPHRRGVFVGAGTSTHPARMRRLMDDGRGRSAAGGERSMIIGIGSDLIDIRRIEKIARALRRALHRAHLHRRSRQRKSERRRAARRLLCQALRRQGGLRQGARHRHARAASSGATWASSTCRAGKPTMELTGGAAERLATLAPAGPPGA